MGSDDTRKAMPCSAGGLVGAMSVPMTASADTLWAIGDSNCGWLGWLGKIVTAPSVGGSDSCMTAHNEYRFRAR